MSDTTLDFAVSYARMGWAVVPLLPGTKRPAWNDWPRRATTDPQEIEAWWTANPDHGVGIATGEVSGIWVLDIDPRNGGDETLADIEKEYGPTEHGVEVLTGGGGRHLYFTYPEGRTVHAGILGTGIDVKSNGGQVVAPPTIHPDTEIPYTFEISSTAVGPAPEWLLDLVSNEGREAAAKTASTPREDLALSPLAWDRYNATATNKQVADFMVELGWTILETTRSGVVNLQRPDTFEGENKEGLSATVGAVTGAPGVLYCWTSSMGPRWEAERTYNPAAVLAQSRFGGDEAAADEWLVAQDLGVQSHFDDPDLVMDRWLAHAAVETTMRRREAGEDDPWADVDINRILTEPPLCPDLVARSDGAHFLYPGAVHWVTGEPASGKTWMALLAAGQVLSWGGHVTYIDYENGPIPLVERCGVLRIPVQRMIRQLHIKHAGASWLEAQERIISDVAATGTRLLVIDSCASAMSAARLDPIDNADFGTFFAFVRRLTSTGAAVIVLDHLKKDALPTEKYPMGAGQKFAQAEVAFGVVRSSAFAPGRAGQSSIYLHKDRHGQIIKVAERVGDHDIIGKLVLDSVDPENVTAGLYPYDAGTHHVASVPRRKPPYDVMQGISDLFVERPNRSFRKSQIVLYMTAPASDVDLALDVLLDRHFIEEISGERNSITYRQISPYRAIHDPLSEFYQEVEDAPKQ